MRGFLSIEVMIHVEIDLGGQLVDAEDIRTIDGFRVQRQCVACGVL